MRPPAPQPSDVLTSPEVDAVVRILLYHATPEVRRALMAHCPVAYVKLCGGGDELMSTVMAEVARAMVRP